MKKQTSEGLQQTRLRIIEAANEAFRLVGVKDVTMDSIARTLKMSKRTIYEVFPSKEVLLLECIKLCFEREDNALAEIEASCENHLEYLLRAFEYKMEELARCNPKMFLELDAYPSVHTFFQERFESRKAYSLSIFNKGVEEGYFRPFINHEVVYYMTHRLLEVAIRSTLFDAVPLEELFANTVLLYLSGCVTAKGAVVIEDFFKRYDLSK